MQNHLIQTPAILPRGALLYTALIHFHRTSAQISKSSSRRQLYGDRSESAINWFGIGAERTSQAYFGGGISTHDVLIRHTLFGYYSLGLSERRSSEWASSLAEGRKDHSTRYVRNARGAMVSGSLRWCPFCVGEDSTEYGFAAWKVIHQLPFVMECAVHGCALLCDCAHCGHALDSGKTLRLPGEACVRCQSTQFSALSPPKNVAYSEFVRRCATVIEDQDAIYRPQNWSALMDAVVSQVGSLENVRRLIDGQLITAWGVEAVDDIWCQWFKGYRSSYLTQVLQGHLTVSPLAVQVLVLQAIEAEFPLIRSQSGPTMVEENSHSVGESDNEYVRHALLLGVNERVAALVSRPQSVIKVASELQISPHYARKLMNRVRDSADGVCVEGRRSEERRQTQLQTKWIRRREACRARVREILRDHPETGRTAMWSLCKWALLWLNEHDREWLDQNVPLRIR